MLSSHVKQAVKDALGEMEDGDFEEAYYAREVIEVLGRALIRLEALSKNETSLMTIWWKATGSDYTPANLSAFVNTLLKELT